MKNLLKKIYNLDFFSKIIIFLLLILIGYLFYTITLDINKKSTSDNNLLEVSQKKNITINEYFFESYQVNRYADDVKLYIKINEEITVDDLKKLEFKLIPNQPIEVTLFASNLIEIKYLEKSPADLKENILIVLDSGKQLLRINYKNLSVEDSKAEILPFKRTE